MSKNIMRQNDSIRSYIEPKCPNTFEIHAFSAISYSGSG